MHDPFCSRNFFLLFREQFYSLMRSFNLARSQAPNVAIRMQTYWQFVDFSNSIPKSLFYQSKKIFCPQMKKKKRKAFVWSSFSFRQTGWNLPHSARGNLQTFAKYYLCTSRLLYVLTFASSKMNEFFFGAKNTNKCLLLTLGFGSKCLKRHVVVLYMYRQMQRNASSPVQHVQHD